VDLKPRKERKLTADQVIEELRPKFARVPGVRVVLSNPPAIGSADDVAAQYQFSLQDPDTESYTVWRRVRDALRNVPGCSTSIRTFQIKNPELAVTLDRSRSQRSPDRRSGELALSSAYGSRQISQIFAPDDEYQVIMQVAPQYQLDPAALSMLYVRRQ